MKKSKQPTKPPVQNNLQKKLTYNFFVWAPLVIVFITTAIYYKSLNNKIPVWDDVVYITENPDISILNDMSASDALKKTFTSYEMGNYHPITMLSYFLEYKFFSLNAKAFHVTNLILHILNSFLVFSLIWLLTKQKWVSFITAVLFAIHPMHVESVAWVSERKDVLFSFFYLSALCTYILSIQYEKWKWHLYAATLMLFLLSVLSKGVAVTLPIAFFIIDYYLGFKINFKNILLKLPFLIFALVFGYIAILAQQSIEAVHTTNYNFFDRILFANYAIVQYLLKLILPINLSGIYNYPKKSNGFYPIWVYISPVIIIVLSYLIFKAKEFKKELLVGSAFFIVHLLLILQLLPVGGAIMADRYTYLPYIGIFFIIATIVDSAIQNKAADFKVKQILSISIVSLFMLVYGVLAYNRTKVWNSGVSLWTDVIENYGEESKNYRCRGDAFYKEGQLNNAVIDYGNAIRLNDKDVETYNNRGLIYFKLEKYNEAISDFTNVIKLDPLKVSAYHARGASYAMLNDYQAAINDYTITLKLEPGLYGLYYDRGVVYEKFNKFNEAINDYSKAIEYNQNATMAYNNRARLFAKTGNYSKAFDDFNSAIKLDPNDVNAHFNMGGLYYMFGKYIEALNEFSITIRLNPNDGNAYNQRSLAYFYNKQYDLAFKDAIKARELGYSVDPNYVNTLYKKKY